ncbi:hypothetical protein Nham_2295 [Nitrobacter hamburgensis X14]|uniref:Uncharacterized protein n=2 Tax=Nitrobacter hamburgensis TaxID=912 RepID=Q1QL10_NITHX|nr:hypothetical protein Nham_2295 [Nitrobacter hamburgensis X14]
MRRCKFGLDAEDEIIRLPRRRSPARTPCVASLSTIRFRPMEQLEAQAMLADIKEQIFSIMSLRLAAVLAPAVALSILAGMVMYALGYPAMVYVEVLLILKTLMHLVLVVWSALKAILYGIVVFGLLLALFLPVLIILWQIRKKRNEPSAVSGPTPQPASNMADAMRQ